MAAGSPPTLRSIAKLAGVSPMAVSLALRNNPRISDATRERVRKIAGELGYHPNSFATSLVSLRSPAARQYRGTLALLNCHSTRNGWRTSPTFCRFYRGIQRRAEELGYTMDEFWLPDPEVSIRRLQHMLESRGIHGVIFAFYNDQQEQMAKLQRFDFSRFACVTISRRIPDQSIFLVSNDQYHDLTLACDHLLAYGYRRIGLVLNETVDAGLGHRFRGAFLAWSPGGVKADRAPILNMTAAPAAELPRWIKNHRLDAVLAFPHDIHHRLREKKISVPEQIGLAYLDRPTFEDGLAGIDQSSERVGSVAVDILTTQINHNERGSTTEQKSLFIDGRWMDGWSIRRVAPPVPLSAARAGNVRAIAHGRRDAVGDRTETR